MLKGRVVAQGRGAAWGGVINERVLHGSGGVTEQMS